MDTKLKGVRQHHRALITFGEIRERFKLLENQEHGRIAYEVFGTLQ